MSIFDICINIIEATIVVLFLSKYFVMKSSYTYIAGFILIVIYSLAVTGINYYIGYDGIYSVLISLCIILPTLIIYAKGHILEKTYISLFTFELISMVNMSVLIISSYLLYGGLELETLLSTKNQYYYIIIILSKVALYIVTQLIARLRRKIHATMDTGNLLIFITVSFISTFVYVFLDTIMFGEVFDVNKIGITMVGVLFLNVFVIFLFFKLQEDSEQLVEKELKIQALSFQDSLTETILEANKETSKVRHDLKHFLSHLDYLLDAKEINEAKEAIENHLNIIEKSDTVVITSNKILNYILNSKYMIAKAKGIKIIYILNFEKKLEIADIDLVTLLGNAIDNAIEHGVGDSIEIKIEENGGYVNVTISNKVDKSVLEYNPDFETQKKHRGHGYGVKSMREIIERNDGLLDFDEKDSTFICTILIK